MTKPERIPLNILLETRQGPEKFEDLADAVRQGAVFIYPTETIYGIGGAYNVRGVREKIFSAKRRAAHQRLILIASDRSCFSNLSITFTPSAERLAQKFWPGMLTLVLPSPNERQGIAVRVSEHPFLKELFRYIDVPIFSTSANLSGESYANDPGKICSLFSGVVDYFIDAGILPLSLPSTVVRIGMDDAVTVLREGAVSSRDVFASLQNKK